MTEKEIDRRFELFMKALRVHIYKTKFEVTQHLPPDEALEYEQLFRKSGEEVDWFLKEMGGES